MKIKRVIVDAFCYLPYTGGNRAAVCLLDEEVADDWMQRFARAFNFSASAILLRDDAAGPNGFRLRWFSPTKELALCGHGTLASAHILWESGEAADEPLHFATAAGPLICTRYDRWIGMDFPAEPIMSTEPPPPGLIEALGVEPSFVGRNHYDYLVALDEAEAVRAATPDFDALRRIPTRGVILTAPDDRKYGHSDYDFISRFFAPAAGIEEDDATGSAHCCLGPFWGERLGKDDLTGFQASPRGAAIRVRLGGDRVELLGQAYRVGLIFDQWRTIPDPTSTTEEHTHATT